MTTGVQWVRVWSRPCALASVEVPNACRVVLPPAAQVPRVQTRWDGAPPRRTTVGVTAVGYAGTAGSVTGRGGKSGTTVGVAAVGYVGTVKSVTGLGGDSGTTVGVAAVGYAGTAGSVTGRGGKSGTTVGVAAVGYVGTAGSVTGRGIGSTTTELVSEPF